MNKFFYSGSFRKISYKEGSGFIFKVGSKRDYKNKTTGKTDYDNVTFIASAFNEATVKFIDKYVKDGDFVEVEGHFHSYTTEKDGVKTYHEDKICDSFRLVGSKGAAAEEKEEETENPKDNLPEGFEALDDDCPW